MRMSFVFCFLRFSPLSRGPGANLRGRRWRRPPRRRHGRAVGAGRSGHHRRPHRRHRRPQPCDGDDTHRCHGAGRGAGLHRHAGPVRGLRPRGRPRRVEDHAGHHHRDHRRGQVHRPCQRADDRRRQALLGPLRHRPGLQHAGRLLRAARAPDEAGDQRRQLRRRRRRARLRDGPRKPPGHVPTTWPPWRSWSSRPCRKARWA